MSYSDDAVLAKLSTLNETQEGIVTVAQWLMFHKLVDLKTSMMVMVIVVGMGTATGQAVLHWMEIASWLAVLGVVNSV